MRSQSLHVRENLQSSLVQRAEILKPFVLQENIRSEGASVTCLRFRRHCLLLLDRIFARDHLPMASKDHNLKGNSITHSSSSAPIHHLWQRTIPGRCTNGDNIQLVIGAFNCVFDFIIIILVIRDLTSLAHELLIFR